MEFTVRLDQFEGPLDLMLHLIQKNKLDLLDLDLDVLAGQYVSYIQAMQDLQLEIASEYLAEFAWLLEYKSRRLLPKPAVEVSDTYEEDQRQKLAARLLEYQQYKQAALALEARADVRQGQINRPKDSLIEEWSVPQERAGGKEDAFKLILAMKRALRRQQLLHPYETSMEVKELSVEERMAQIRQFLPDMPSTARLQDFCWDVSSLRAVIVTFLAVLELIHVSRISYYLDEEENVWIKTR